MSQQMPVLFYSDMCQFCGDGLIPIVEFFAAEGINLIVRKPSAGDIDKIPGYPALFIPKAFGSPVMLIGAGAVEPLKERPELARYHGCSLNYLEDSSAGEGGTALQRTTPGDRRVGALRLESGARFRYLANRDVTIVQRDPECRSGCD